MNRKISDLLDACGDPGLEIQANTPLSSERILALTRNRIRPSKVTRRHPVLRVLTIAAILAVMAVSILAAENGAAWFQTFWGNHGEARLSDEQIALIEKTSAFIGQSQAVDGYTVYIDSVMNDGRIVYIKLDIYGPDGVVFPYGENLSFENVLLYTADGGKISCGWSFYEIIDEDKTDNHRTELMGIDIQAGGEPLSLTGAVLELDTLYKERVRLLSRTKEILAAGTWSFDLNFTAGEDDLWEKELVGAPISCVMEKNATGEETAISFTSIRLRPLTIDAVYDYPGGGDLAALNWRGAKIVKKDGSIVEILPSGGKVLPEGGKITGYISFTTDMPIVLREVAYLEFPDGTQVFVNAEA